MIVKDIAWNKVGKTVEGILVGFGEEFSGNFGTCLNDVEKDFEEIKSVVELLIKHDEETIK